MCQKHGKNCGQSQGMQLMTPGKKRWTPNPGMKNFPTKYLIQKHKTKKNAEICACATKNIFGTRIKKTSSIGDHGKNVTIEKNIMNYILPFCSILVLLVVFYINRSYAL